MKKSASNREIVETGCPVCGSERFSPRYPARGDLRSGEFFREGVPLGGRFPIVECLHCGLAYSRPRDPDPLLKEMIAGQSLGRYLERTAGREKNFRAQLGRIEVLRGGKGTLLDLGCAAGFFCRVASQAGWKAVGYDAWPEAVEYGRTQWNLELRVLDANEWDTIDGEYDAIVLWDTIEHLPEPGKLLSDLKSKLKTGGILAIGTPDYGSLSRRLLGSSWHFFERHHLTFFSRATLANALTARGYAVCECRGQKRRVSLDYLAGYLVKWSPRLSVFSKKIVKSLAGEELFLSIPSGMMICYAVTS